LCGVDHLVNSAEIVERLINKPHSHKPWRLSRRPGQELSPHEAFGLRLCPRRSPQQVFDLLAQHGDDARVLAGGQTLLAGAEHAAVAPSLLVDIGALDGLRGIAVQGGSCASAR
jgi:hypothetical protein